MARALIVDDDEPIRSMLATIVRHSGLQVETAGDGDEAIDSIGKDGFDVVLLDLMMPRVDGWAVLRFMRECRPDLLAHTIIATAVPEREALRRIEDPVYRVHIKPFEIDRLVQDVKNAAAV